VSGLEERTRGPLPTLLEVSGLQVYYGRSHVVRGIDLRVGKGETVSLLGRNGMGKTTTLRAVMGQIRARGGKVGFDGRDLTGAAATRVARSGIGYVPEGRGIFPNLTVRENLVMSARPGVDGRRDWTLERVLALFPRLAERSGNWGDRLSGGEQQMLAIGRALMTNPRLLILDEATEGLAPLIREEIWRTVALIRADGIACIIVDKNVERLLRLCDRHVMLAKGEVVFEGTSADLAAQPEVLHRHLGV